MRYVTHDGLPYGHRGREVPRSLSRAGCIKQAFLSFLLFLCVTIHFAFVSLVKVERGRRIGGEPGTAIL